MEQRPGTYTLPTWPLRTGDDDDFYSHSEDYDEPDEIDDEEEETEDESLQVQSPD